MPCQDHPNNNTSGGYIKYYSRDYDPPPPPPLSYNRNSIFTTTAATNQGGGVGGGGGAALNNLDPRYSAAYGNPYLRVPNRSGSQGLYGSSGGIDGGTALGGVAQTPQPILYGGGGGGGGAQTHLMNNNTTNNNTLNNTSAIYGQNRNNLRLSASLNNQYITVAQGDGRNGVHGTHI